VRSWPLVRDRQTCVGCGKKSPETETNYTLISAQFGWRLTRYKSPEGALIVEWRCPTCWRDYKRARTTPAEEPPATRPSQPPAPTQPPLRATLPRPPTPFESFRPRAPSTPDANGTGRPPPRPPPRGSR
jgi:hypothetical protein